MTQDRYKQLFQMSPDPIFILNMKGEFQEINNAFCKVSGYSREEIIGLSLKDSIPFLPENHRKQISRNFKKRLQGEDISPYSIKIINKSGNTLYMELKSSPLTDNGETVGTIGIARDITELYNLEKNLRRSRNYLQSIITTIPDLIMLFDKNCNYLDIWTSTPADLVAPKKELIGKNIQNYLPEAVVEKYHKHCKQALKNNQLETFEYQLNFDGETKYFEAHLTGLNAVKNGKKEILATIRNISKRKQTEDKLRKQKAYFQQLFDNSTEAIVLLNNDNNVIKVNNKFEEVFGYNESEVKGENLDDLITPKSYLEGGTYYAQKVKNGNSVNDETTRITKGGKKIDVSLRGFPIKLPEGQIGIYAVYNDITERKEREKKIEFLSFHDELTGLFNRRYFENEISILNESRRLPISIIIGDMDGLKYVNDNFGHKTGDKFIKKIGEVFRKTTRSEDIIARIGGDEFAIILPETSNQAAQKLCRRIHEECKYVNRNQPLPVPLSISLGASTMTEEEENLGNIFEKADQKMYINKGRGASYNSR